MKINQKGFGVVEGLLAVIAITLVVGVGFYVFNANKDDSSAQTGSTSTQKNSTDTTGTKDPYKGWQTYTNTETGFTLKYPADWQFNAKDTTSDSSQGGFGSNQFTSVANYKANNNSHNVSFDTDNTSFTTAEQYEKDYVVGKISERASSTSSTINGYSAQTDNVKNPHSHEPTIYEVFVVNKGKVVIFNYYIDGEYTDTYKAIVSSIKFN